MLERLKEYFDIYSDEDRRESQVLFHFSGHGDWKKAGAIHHTDTRINLDPRILDLEQTELLIINAAKSGPFENNLKTTVGSDISQAFIKSTIDNLKKTIDQIAVAEKPTYDDLILVLDAIAPYLRSHEKHNASTIKSSTGRDPTQSTGTESLGQAEKTSANPSKTQTKKQALPATQDAISKRLDNAFSRLNYSRSNSREAKHSVTSLRASRKKQSSFGQWAALFGGVLIQPFFRSYQTNGKWLWDGFWGWTFFALITSFIIFPAVYRHAFDKNKPVMVQLAPIFAAGLGWHSLLATAVKVIGGK